MSATIELLKKLGFHVDGIHGHVFGCPCPDCRDHSTRALDEIRARRARGESGDTLMDVICDAHRAAHCGEERGCGHAPRPGWCPSCRATLEPLQSLDETPMDH